MPLEYINIYNARNLKEFSLSPSPKINIIYGCNGSGKTTIIESIYFLLRSRIFRNNKYKSFININSTECTIFSKFSSNDNCFSLGITRSKNSLQPIIHHNKLKVNSLSEISNLALLGLITPESFNLLDSGPGIRRKFLDWGVFHVEHKFIDYWKSYKKIVNNRNNVLKKIQSRHINFDSIPEHELQSILCWSPQLIEFNNKLDNLRQIQLNKIKSIFIDYLKLFSTVLSSKITIEYYKGWTANMSFDDFLADKLQHDLASGYTRYGTHRSDIIIKYDGHLAKDILSRGQKKIVVICLILSQFSFLNNLTNNQHSLLLLDDMDSELDDRNLNILFNLLSDINKQVIATSTNKEKYNFIKDRCKMFHVEHLNLSIVNS